MLNLHAFVVGQIKPLSLAARRDLALRSGVSFWTINKYAYGQIKEPSSVKLQRIANALEEGAAA